MRSPARSLTRPPGAGRLFFVACLLFIQAFGIAICHGQSGQEELHVYSMYAMADCVSGQREYSAESDLQMACSTDSSATNDTVSTFRSSSPASGMVFGIMTEPVCPLPPVIILEQGRQHFAHDRDVPLPEDQFIGIPKQPPRFV